MAILDEIRNLARGLTASDKRTLIAELVREGDGLSVGIEKTPGVMGGRACVVRTRIPVWILDLYRTQGASDADLLESYPSLTASDLANAWSYAAAHRAEIDGDIAEQEADD